MFKNRYVAIGAMVLMAGAGWAHATTVFLDENFDGYADQAAFQAAWPVSGTASTVLNTDQSVSAPKSVQGLTTATRNIRNVGEIGFMNGSPETIIFRFDFYDSDSAASPYRQYAELVDGSPVGSGQLYAMGLNNNLLGNYYMARILGADGGSGTSAFFRLDGAGAPVRSTGWHTLEARITDTSVSYYVDSVLSKTVDISGLTDRSLDTVRVGSNLSSTRVAYFDNIHVELTPEPVTVTLLAMGALFLRRRMA